MGANLMGANLAEANLRGVNLMGVNLMGANIAGANLHNANLENTNLCGVAEKMGIPLDPQLPEKILHQITTHPETWNQEDWHNACGTKHCIAGWTIALSGKLGTYLERNLTTPVAATLLLWRDGYPLPSFHPYASKDECLARLQAMAEGAHACQS